MLSCGSFSGASGILSRRLLHRERGSPHGCPVGGAQAVKLDGAVYFNSEQTLRRVLTEGLKLSRFGGGEDVTKLICGYMTCDP